MKSKWLKGIGGGLLIAAGVVLGVEGDGNVMPYILAGLGMILEILGVKQK